MNDTTLINEGLTENMIWKKNICSFGQNLALPINKKTIGNILIYA